MFNNALTETLGHNIQNKTLVVSLAHTAGNQPETERGGGTDGGGPEPAMMYAQQFVRMSEERTSPCVMCD